MRQRVGVVVLAALFPACSFAPGLLSRSDSGTGSDADAPASDPDVLPDIGEPGPWLAGFGFRKKITITPPALGGSLSDFPVALVRASDADISTHARSDGRDLVVTSADAMTLLDSELASFDASSGALEIWVRIPTLPLTGSTTLYLYYGGPPTPTSAATVWAATAGFASVWHLSTESGTGAADSAPLANHLFVDVLDTSPAASAGIAGAGRSPMIVTDRLQHVDDNTLDFASASFSFSVWVRETASVGQYDAAFYKGGTNSCCPGYSLLLGTGDWGVKIHDGGGGSTNNAGSDWVSAGFGDQALLTNRWVHLVSVIDRTANQLRAYADGVLTDTQAITNVGPLTSSVNLAIGRGSAGAWFNGLIDEARVYSLPLTAPWIATEHANLIDTSFVVFGPQAAL